MGRNVRRTKRLIKRRINSAKKRFTKSRIKVSNRKSKIKVSKKRLTKRRMKVSKRKNKQKMKRGGYTDSDVDFVMQEVFKWNQDSSDDDPDIMLYPRRGNESVFDFLKKNRVYIEKMGLRDTFEDIFDNREDWQPPISDTSKDRALAAQMKALSTAPPVVDIPKIDTEPGVVGLPGDSERETRERKEAIDNQREREREQALQNLADKQLQRKIEAAERRAAREALREALR